MIMKNLSIKSVLALALSITLFSSCTKDWHGLKGTGAITTESRNVDNFTGVDLQLAGRVNIVPDSQFFVSITSYDNYHTHIRTYVRSGSLVIDSYKSLHDDVDIDIHLPYIDYINLGGSGSITTSGNFNSNTMKIQITGSGNIDYAGTSNTLIANVSGSGKISMLGSATNSVMTMSGSGKINAYPMHCKKNTVTISGSGAIETFVIDELKANISGSGKVSYMGNPSVIQAISGSGKIVHKQ